MKQFFTFLAAVVLTATTYAQVGIGTTTPEASAALDITSTTKGLLPPRMTTNERDLISSAATGLIVFNTTLNTLQINEGDATTSNWVSLSAAATSPTYNIGDIVNGGVVFWLDSTGQHGLVVAFSDAAFSVEWGCHETDLQNVPSAPYNGNQPVGLGTEIGDGFNNTNNILKDCPTAPAALAARSYGPDWFLPSINELKKIYDNTPILDGVSGFIQMGEVLYWSSSESDNNFTWSQAFKFPDMGIYDKDYDFGVRAVRAF